ALLAAAAEAARGETFALRWWSLVEEGSELADALGRLGFAASRRFLRFEIQANAYHERLTGLLGRMGSLSTTEAELRLVPLARAPPAGVGEFIAATFPASAEETVERLAPGAARPYDGALSVVALEGGRVVGAMLATREATDAIDVDVYAIAPERRRGR